MHTLYILSFLIYLIVKIGMTIKLTLISNLIITFNLSGSLVPQMIKSCLQCWRPGFNPWFAKIPWRRKWQPTPVLLSGKSHGQRSLVGCSPQGLEESDTTEQLHFHFSLSCIGEGNGNPLPAFLPGESQGWWEPRGLPSLGSHRIGHD